MDLTEQQIHDTVSHFLGYGLSDRALAAISKFFSDLLSAIGAWFTELSDKHPILGFLFLLGLVAILMLVVWHIVYTVRGIFRAEEQLETGEDEAGAIAQHLVHLEASERLAAEGNYIDGIRELFIAAALCVQERDGVPYRRSDTNREYLGRIKEAAPGVAPAVEELASLVDDKWYGMEEATASDYEHVRERVRELIRV